MTRKCISVIRTPHGSLIGWQTSYARLASMFGYREYTDGTHVRVFPYPRIPAETQGKGYGMAAQIGDHGLSTDGIPWASPTDPYAEYTYEEYLAMTADWPEWAQE